MISPFSALRMSSLRCGRRYLEKAIHSSVRRARIIVAVSRQTREDLIEIWGIPAERIYVVAPAVAASMGRITDPTRLQGLRQQWGVTRPFFLFVGTIEPRKNLPTLLHAFARHGGRDWIPMISCWPAHWIGLEGSRQRISAI